MALQLLKAPCVRRPPPAPPSALPELLGGQLRKGPDLAWLGRKLNESKGAPLASLRDLSVSEEVL